MFNGELTPASAGDQFCDWLLMKRTRERAARFWSPLQCVQVFLLLLQCILPFTFFKGQHRQNINFFAFLGPSFTLAILSLLHVGLLFCGRLWCFFWPQRLTYGLAFLLGFSSLLALAAKLSSMELGVPLRVQMFVTNNGAAPLAITATIVVIVFKVLELAIPPLRRRSIGVLALLGWNDAGVVAAGEAASEQVRDTTGYTRKVTFEPLEDEEEGTRV